MIERTFKGKLLVFSVFFLGIISGAMMTYAWETRVSSHVSSVDVKSADRAKADVNKFYDYLGLSPEQRIQVKQITEDSRPEFNKIFQQTRPQMEAIQKQTRSKIRAVLTEEQRQKYDKFNAENEARRNKQKPQPQHSN
jgi:uncharacterized membrane protein